MASLSDYYRLATYTAAIQVSGAVYVHNLPLLPWERVPYLSALEVCSRRGAIQIHVYLYLYSPDIHFTCTCMPVVFLILSMPPPTTNRRRSRGIVFRSSGRPFVRCPSVSSGLLKKYDADKTPLLTDGQRPAGRKTQCLSSLIVAETLWCRIFPGIIIFRFSLPNVRRQLRLACQQ